MLKKKITDWLYVRSVLKEFKKYSMYIGKNTKAKLKVTATTHIEPQLGASIVKALTKRYKKYGQVNVRIFLPECSFDQQIYLTINADRWGA